MKKKRKYLVNRLKVYLKMIHILLGLLVICCSIFLFEKTENLLGVAVLVGAYSALLVWAHYFLKKRYLEISKMFQLFKEGYLVDEFFDADLKISPLCDDVISIMKEMLDRRQYLNVAKKQAEYLALQNQINPHFLYNTLEGIRSEALCAGMDTISEMTEALSTFFRYTISNTEHLVTLEEELNNIENYYIIQQFRFGERLNLRIEYDEDALEVLDLYLPKLTLQPVVENAIYHGIERKVGKGTLKVIITATKERLIIVVSDDGMGMPKEKLDELNHKMRTTSMDDVDTPKEKKGGIALINVNNRIKLLFGEQYGIHIYSAESAGTDVEITLPIVRESDI